jgi:glyoxylate reductase
LLDGVRGCTGILSLLSDRIDAEVCEAAGSELCVVSNFAVGVNNIDLEEMKRRGIAVGNTPDVLTEATADIAVALMLAAGRRLAEARDDVLCQRWKTWEPLGWLGVDFAMHAVGDSPSPKRLGIVGMGRIGEAVAKRMYGGWGMEVVYTARTQKSEVEQRLAAKRLKLNELLETSDFVSLHVPLTPKTRHLIGADELRRMKRNAVLVNTARGEIVDQAALVSALEESQIFAAGLDVCDPEPIPDGHPLLSLENCILLPHIGSATQAARSAMAARAADNLLAGMQHQPLPFSVF